MCFSEVIATVHHLLDESNWLVLTGMLQSDFGSLDGSISIMIIFICQVCLFLWSFDFIC